MFHRPVIIALALCSGCADEYSELYETCPERGDCFFNVAQWKRIEGLTCLECEPGFPAGAAPVEASNEVATDPRAVELGRELFEDKNLGATGLQSCETCHDPSTWFTSRTEQGPEVRNITTALNAAYYEWYAWHGGRDSLWSLALVPLEKAPLLNGHRLRIVHYVAEVYGSQFAALFPDAPDAAEFPACGATHEDCKTIWDGLPADDPRHEPIDRAFANVGKVLASYMYTLTSGPTPFDDYVARRGEIDESAKRGLALFIGKAHCISCHDGPALTDNEFHNIGLRGVDPEPSDRASAVTDFATKRRFTRAGPFSAVPESAHLDALVPDPNLEGAFRTPSLRNVAMTSAYMRNGEFASLQDVVWHYDAALGPAAGELDEDVWPLELTSAEVEDLSAFLRTLTERKCLWNGEDGCPPPV